MSYLSRRLHVVLGLFTILSSLWLLYRAFQPDHVVLSTVDIEAEPTRAVKLPPNYYEWYEKEKAMPQNNPNLPSPQGRNGRYVRFKNWWGDIGWGNALQELIIHAHIAYRADRIFTMYNYTWNKETKEDYWNLDFGGVRHTIPVRIPPTVLLDGPIAGGPFPVADWRPPAITTDFFEEVCPTPTIISVGEAKGESHSGSAAAILDAVVHKLQSIESNCVEFEESSGQIFNYELFGDGARMIDAWPQLLRSPILTDWQWSELVISGVNANKRLIHPATDVQPFARGLLPGLLAIHVRRGDFEQHCENLGVWHSKPNAWNMHPDFPDKLELPAGDDNERAAWYTRHCFPSIDQLVQRVIEVRTDAAKQGRSLERIYILSNGTPEWLAGLRTALYSAAKWKSVASSRDLTVTWEQKFVAQVIDQIIAVRAEVFVGNPWSSMSSNINLLRMTQFHHPETCRML